jgi:hypothetical protein
MGLVLHEGPRSRRDSLLSVGSWHLRLSLKACSCPSQGRRAPMSEKPCLVVETTWSSALAPIPYRIVIGMVENGTDPWKPVWWYSPCGLSSCVESGLLAESSGCGRVSIRTFRSKYASILGYRSSMTLAADGTYRRRIPRCEGRYPLQRRVNRCRRCDVPSPCFRAHRLRTHFVSVARSSVAIDRRVVLYECSPRWGCEAAPAKESGTAMAAYELCRFSCGSIAHALVVNVPAVVWSCCRQSRWIANRPKSGAAMRGARPMHISEPPRRAHAAEELPEKARYASCCRERRAIGVALGSGDVRNARKLPPDAKG